ncbi:MAG TPA: hypothetical protein VHE77_21690, partial [Dongiaceae bacterium]|nr:hypothetical protein [Dongiaceae bacterium]
MSLGLSRSSRDTLGGGLLLIALILFIAAPLVGVLLWAFAEQWRPPAVLPTQWGFKYWGMLLARADVQQSLPLSLILASIVTGLSAVICLPAAYALARMQFPGRRFILLSFITAHAFPRFPLYVSIAVIFLSLGLIGTAPAVVMVQLVFSMLYMIW